MAKQRKKTLPEQIEHEEKYVAFLKKALESENFKKLAAKELQEETQNKYDRAKFKLKTLKQALK